MSISNKKFDKCKPTKLTIENPDIYKIDNGYYSYLIEHNKEFDYYLVKCVFKFVFNDYEYRSYIESKLSNKKTMYS